MDENKSTALLKEVIYYCKEDNPTGALLLDGEWGCGKKFFINNILKSTLQDSHVFVRISLFGIQNAKNCKKL